jgi:hypothetical protein
MRNSTSWVFGLWLLLLGTQAYADGQATAHHALWEVRGAHGSVFLIGSVHVLKADHHELPAPFLDAYTQSTELWMEVDLDQATADALSPETQQLEMLPPDTTLAASLGPQLYQQLMDQAKPLGLELELMSHFQPWFAAVELIETSPGDKGKWFATAKELGLYDMALKLVRESPCDPQTLTRAARDFAEREPHFAHGAGFAALYWLTRGHGYEITAVDVWGAYHITLKAAEQLGTLSDTKMRIQQLVAKESAGGLVRQVLGREIALP